MGQTGNGLLQNSKVCCGFLRRYAVSCGLVRRYAVSCGLLRRSAPWKFCTSQKAKIYKKKMQIWLRLSLLVCPFEFPLKIVKSKSMKYSSVHQRITKGQQLKGKIDSELFTLFHTFSPRTFPFKMRGFSSMRTKEKK